MKAPAGWPACTRRERSRVPKRACGHARGHHLGTSLPGHLTPRASSGHLTPSWSCASLTAPWPFAKHQGSWPRILVLRVESGRTIHAHACTRIHACKHTDMHTRGYTYTYAYVYMPAHTHASFWILKSTALTPQGDFPNINRPAALGPEALTC